MAIFDAGSAGEFLRGGNCGCEVDIPALMSPQPSRRIS